MWFFVYEAYPKPSSPEYEQVDGAFVSCWIDERIESIADALARAVIEEQGWDVQERDQSYEVAEGNYEEGSDSIELFRQAVLDGCVMTFHSWPIGGDTDKAP